MTNEVRALIENRVPLRKVHYEDLGPRLVSRVFLTFAESRYLSFAVDDDTDEVIVSCDSPSRSAEDVSTTSPWAGVVNKPLYAAWSLKNNNDYLDAFQLDFCSTAAEESRIVQLCGMASTLRIFVLVNTN